MARTKQTAARSTGATAPRRALGPAPRRSTANPVEPATHGSSTGHLKKRQNRASPDEGPAAKRTRSNPAQPKPAAQPAPSKTTLGRRLIKTTLGQKGPIGKGESTNGFCYACQNGGDTIACDRCPRILCLRHVLEIAAVEEEMRKTLTFRCPSCHTKNTRALKTVTPYYGLYHAQQAPEEPERPYFSTWIRLDLPAARPQHVQVNTRPILILSVRLATLPDNNNPARLLFNYLVPWFDGAASSGLRYVDIPFDMSETVHATRYRQKWDTELAALGPLTNTRIVIFIYNHSHEQTGDLFYGEETCSVSLAQWWADVISPGLKQIAANGENELTIAMLVCGSLLGNEQPRRELIAAVDEMQATHAFAFVTERLQPFLTIQFFQAFALRHLLEGATLSGQVMAALLEQSSSLARHSAVWHISRAAGETELMLREYRWTHPTMRPHGEDIGLQCPACGSLSSRQAKTHYDKSVTVSCKKKDCHWKHTYVALDGAQPLNATEGVWIARSVTLS